MAALTFTRIQIVDRTDKPQCDFILAATLTPHSRTESKTYSLLVRAIKRLAKAATAGRVVVPYGHVIITLRVLVRSDLGHWHDTLSFGCAIGAAGYKSMKLLQISATKFGIRRWLRLVGRKGAIRVAVRALEKIGVPRLRRLPLEVKFVEVAWERAWVTHQGFNPVHIAPPNFAALQPGMIFFAAADRRHFEHRYRIEARLGRTVPVYPQHIKMEVDDGADYEAANSRTPSSAFWSEKYKRNCL